MDFAPYQSSPPEHSRPFSPPQSPSPRTSYDNPYARGGQPKVASPPPLLHPQPQRKWSYPQDESGDGAGDSAGYQRSYQDGGGLPAASMVEEGRYGVSEFDTSLGLRLDYEAAAAYVAFPPIGAIALLILERGSDYVR